MITCGTLFEPGEGALPPPHKARLPRRYLNKEEAVGRSNAAQELLLCKNTPGVWGQRPHWICHG
ncbi:hypothetical protein SAMN04488078_1001101 [Antarctobacter heliothermus]|uniref:Uncharacterized protein n=1 Tax=Antarctobacter heliothermus TaxID=74033 RepID=A0A239ATA0_9RHOB|nr:hypothetical protein SAMN04488078_1001101 [Antarctobacter heliothermus]